ncbi:polyprotein [Phytophthora megakarya]|uniref:Polyprotein n=1 Tax=Phytophthora megakarya TaxID=4795 RepID=A0A225VW44_9STRA|nr:polyprotein [Phytophthora megakarya]
MNRASDGPLCVACSAVVHDVHWRRSPRRRGENNIAVEQGLPHANEMMFEQGLPSARKTSVEQGIPHEAVERGLPYDDSTGAVDHDLLHLKEVPATATTLRRAQPRCEGGLPSAVAGVSSRDVPPSPSELLVAQTVNALEYVEGGPRRQRTLEVATPPKDAKSIIQLPGLSWKHFLRDLKASEIEQICLITDADSVSPMVNATSASDDISARPKNSEPKSAREERFETQSWEALRESQPDEFRPPPN